jgi:cytochrome c peroxidase
LKPLKETRQPGVERRNEAALDCLQNDFWNNGRAAFATLLVIAGAWLCLPGFVCPGFAEPASIARASQTNAFIQRFKIPRAAAAGFPEPRADPAKVAIGERLFLETRFSQFFFANSRGNANATLAKGDSVVSTSVTTGEPLPGPFAGHAINCRSCHLVNEHHAAGRGNRTYTDYARRSPVPLRSDGRTQTARNSPAMVNATIPREREMFLHFDGEFVSGKDLVKATLTGRNFGWMPGEYSQAIQHIAHIIRDDDGHGPLAREFGGYSYRRVLAGDDPELGEETERFRLPVELRFDVARASDEQVLDAVARLITVYMDSLFFSRDERNEYDSSPYDCFLETNQIPRKPDPGQSSLYYNRNLLDLVNGPAPHIFVSPTNGFTFPLNGRFKTFRQEFRFGPDELLGMKIFFTMARYATNANRRPTHGIGNCAACHPGPDFTDFSFHNTGAAQEEYDSLHGAGAFAQLEIPGLATRNANYNAWLPATGNHPHARGPFLDVPSAGQPDRTDLGLWNVFANPDQPLAQAALRRLLNGETRPAPDEVLLPRTIGMFKTPSLRGLVFSDPYLHTGAKNTLEDVIRFYRRMSGLARSGKMRNAAPELSGIFLQDEDVAPLAAFLRSLNEDYE